MSRRLPRAARCTRAASFRPIKRFIRSISPLAAGTASPRRGLHIRRPTPAAPYGTTTHLRTIAYVYTIVQCRRIPHSDSQPVGNVRFLKKSASRWITSDPGDGLTHEDWPICEASGPPLRGRPIRLHTAATNLADLDILSLSARPEKVFPDATARFRS